MIKGLKKDHTVLSDLIFTEFENIQQCLLDTFNTYIELFIKTECTKLLEVIYLKDCIKSIQISKLYYQTSLNNEPDISTLINELQSTIIPIFTKCSIVLESISKDPKTFAYHTSFYNFQIILNLYQEYNEIFTSFNSILSSFQTFLINSKSTTEFNTPEMSFCSAKPSSNSRSSSITSDVIIINFNDYDQSYTELIDDLYHLDELLKDLKEDIIKNSPCFKEYMESKTERFGADFDEYKYDLFKKERVERLGIDNRRIFGAF